jgi:hypothetical protein
MYGDWFYLEQERKDRERALARSMRERRVLAQLEAKKPSMRARLARGLFGLAVATEREETWRAVWERLEAKGRP